MCFIDEMRGVSECFIYFLGERVVSEDFIYSLDEMRDVSVFHIISR